MTTGHLPPGDGEGVRKPPALDPVSLGPGGALRPVPHQRPLSLPQAGPRVRPSGTSLPFCSPGWASGARTRLTWRVPSGRPSHTGLALAVIPTPPPTFSAGEGRGPSSAAVRPWRFCPWPGALCPERPVR